MVVALDELTALGVGFASVTEPFDTSTPSGRLLMQIVSSMAEFERSILIERTKAGLAAAKRRGVRLGQRPARIDHDRLLDMHEAGKSLREIAKELGVGPATIHRTLKKLGAGDPLTPKADPQEAR
jgi:DNA invertase Pin-like site-specific DNA recombinase